MNKPNVVGLFPGQGAFSGGSLIQAAEKYPQISKTFAEIDAVAQAQFGFSVSATILRPDPPSLAELLASAPELLQFAIYGISVATYQILAARTFAPTVLVGHSFGEIAALVCAGAFSVRDGAIIVGQRIAALQTLGQQRGCMTVLSTNLARAEQLLSLVGSPEVAIAAENYDSQVVVSGSEQAVSVVEELARVIQIQTQRVSSAYAFHCPLIMQPVATRFAASIQQIEQQPLQTPVFSPILGRYYRDDDTLSDCLGQHLVRPVYFARSMQELTRTANLQVFVECGALNTLGKLVKNVLKRFDLTTIACLDPKLSNERSLEQALQLLREHGLVIDAPATALSQALLPEVSEPDFDAFWAARSTHVRTLIRHSFEEFVRSQPARLPQPHTQPPLTLTLPVPARPSDISKLPAAVAAPLAPQAVMSRNVLFKELTVMFAAALEYPEEVFTGDVELEAELGIDSVKQTELLAKIGERYGLPLRSLPASDLRLYKTMDKITDLVLSLMERTASDQDQLQTITYDSKHHGLGVTIGSDQLQPV